MSYSPVTPYYTICQRSIRSIR